LTIAPTSSTIKGAVMSIAWVFPGQGSQLVGMGRDLAASYDTAREVFEEADATLDMPISRLCFEGPEEELTRTENAQPTLLTVSTALARTVASHRILKSLAPRAVAGHSLGEYSALVAGGALDFATALRLVRRRGELMAAAHEGTMAAVVGLDEQRLTAICRTVNETLQSTKDHAGTVVIANYNAPDQLVISGNVVAVQHAGILAKEQGAKRVIPLKVSAAFHSPLMMEAAEAMARDLEHATVQDLQFPLIANVTADQLTSAQDVRREIVAQIVAPVRWIASIQHMLANGIHTFVEIGPGKVLSGLIRRIAPQARVLNIGSATDINTVANSVELEAVESEVRV
jgi:[acyl-carrier-protein] S-malonyltransferase